MRGAALVLAAALALLAGCGGDDEPETVTETSTVTEPTTQTVETPETNTVTESDEGSIAQDQAVEIAKDEASKIAGQQGFQVPAASFEADCSGGPEIYECKISRQGCAGTVQVRRPVGGGEPRDRGVVTCAD